MWRLFEGSENHWPRAGLAGRHGIRPRATAATTGSGRAGPRTGLAPRGSVVIAPARCSWPRAMGVTAGGGGAPGALRSLEDRPGSLCRGSCHF